jgi:DNA-binding winged helix-turn-helix (wHTH) protein
MHTTYAFGEFVAHPARRLLTRGSGELVHIHPKAFDALICLLRRPGEVIPRAELAHTLWPKVIVEDNNLSQTIRALRRALGDGTPPHRFISTIPRRGYQFVAPVVEQTAAEASEAIIRVRHPRTSRVGLYVGCVGTLAVLVTTLALWPRSSETEEPSPKPVADTVVEGQVPSWPLPEVVACLPESARRMDPERCAAAFKSVQEAERRRKHGLYEG